MYEILLVMYYFMFFYIV